MREVLSRSLDATGSYSPPKILETSITHEFLGPAGHLENPCVLARDRTRLNEDHEAIIHQDVTEHCMQTSVWIEKKLGVNAVV